MKIVKIVILLSGLAALSACQNRLSLNGAQTSNQAASTSPTSGVNYLPDSNYPTEVNSTVPLAFTNITGLAASSSILYMATNRGLFASSDDGSTFTQLPAMSDPVRLLDPAVEEVFVVGTTLFSVTDYGVVLVSTTGGQSATVAQGITNIGSNIDGMIGSGNFTWSIVAFNGNIYLSNSSQNVYVSANGGTTFTVLSVSKTPLVFNQMAVLGNDLFIASQGGLFSSSDGQTFTDATTAQGLISNNVQFVSALNGNLFVVSQYQNATTPTLSISSNGGTSFTNALPGIEIVGMFQVGSEIFVKSYNGGGNLLASNDDGATFNSISSEYIGYPLNGLGSCTAVLNGSIFSAFQTVGGYPTQLAYSPNGGQDFITFNFVFPSFTTNGQ